MTHFCRYFSVLAAFSLVSLVSLPGCVVAQDLTAPLPDERGEAYLDGSRLVVVGTDEDDEIEVRMRHDSIRIWVNGERVTFDMSDLPAVDVLTVGVWGFAGEDVIELTIDDRERDGLITDRIRIAVYAFGGANDDTIVNSCFAPAMLFGGTGRDFLEAGDSTCVLVGGTLEIAESGAAFYPLPDFELDTLLDGKGTTGHISEFWDTLPTESLQEPYALVRHDRHLAPLYKSPIASRTKTQLIHPAPLPTRHVRIERDDFLPLSDNNFAHPITLNTPESPIISIAFELPAQ